MTNYKIITNTPYDKEAPTTYWIEKKYSHFFGLIKGRKVFGQYHVDEEFGEIGDMPFFSYAEAQERISILEE